MAHDDTAVDFELLLRAAGSGGTPHIETIDRFRPRPEDIEFCRRWLSARGVTCFPSDFSLVCRAPKELLESLFSTKIEAQTKGPGMPGWRFLSDPIPPAEIAAYIEQVEIPAPPELF